MNIPERVLYALTSEVLSKEGLSIEDFDSFIDYIEVSTERKLIYHLRNGQKATKSWMVDKNHHVLEEGKNG